MKNSVVIVAAGLVLLALPPAFAAGNVEAGKAKAQMCLACHGADGNSANPMWPSLAGQAQGYVAKQLGDFKSGKRKDPVMSGMAAGLTPADADNLDAFYTSLALKPAVAANAALAKQGEHLYRGGNAKMGISACMSCHGPSGAGIPPRFPRVSGQHAAYTEKQLRDFKAGARANDDETMTRIAFRMSETEIKAVAEYMQGLK